MSVAANGIEWLLTDPYAPRYITYSGLVSGWPSSRIRWVVSENGMIYGPSSGFSAAGPAAEKDRNLDPGDVKMIDAYLESYRKEAASCVIDPVIEGEKL